MSVFRRFVGGIDGNFGMMAGLAVLPLVFTVGAGIDISRLYAARTGLQAAVDAAALAVVKSGSAEKAEVDAIAKRMVEANYAGGYRSIDVTMTQQGAKVSAETVMPTTLTAVLGYRELVANVSGTVEYPQTRYEIGLVLDTTGSMAGPKLQAMKDAAEKMVDRLSANDLLRSRVRFALVPFSAYVNVGKDKASASWIDSGGLVHLPGSIIPTGVSRLEIFRAGFGDDWRGCVETRIESGSENYSVDDTTPSRSQPRSLYVPLLFPDEPGGTSASGRPLYPNNYVSDDSLKGLGVTYVNGLLTPGPASPDVPSYRFPGFDGEAQGPNHPCNTRPILPLTNDATKVKSELSLLSAAGNTNITEGVAWGNRVLSPGEPFPEGAAPGPDVQKIMVLLTDGDNTMMQLNNDKGSSYSSYGYLSDWRWNKGYKTDYGKVCKNGDVPDGDGNCSKKKGADVAAVTQAQILAAMNADTKAACDITKTAGVEVYAIRLMVTTATSSSLLQGCASDSSHYFNATSPDDLPDIFEAIAKRVVKLKITS